MRGLIRRTAVVAGAAVALLGSAAGVASAGGGPVLGWSPTTSQGTYNYGTLQAGQTVSKAFVLTNSGGSATAALKITLTGSGAFTKTADTCTGTSLGPRKSCSVTVQYAPTTPGQGDAATLTAASGKTLASLTLLGAAAKASPAITTSPSSGGTVGAAVKDTAALAGGHSPTGTITFNLYGPSATANCSTTAVDTEKVTVTGDGSYTSPSFTPAQTGTYWWTASYNGDANNSPAATNCGDEQVAISQAAPAIATTPNASGTGIAGGTAVKDTATLSDGDNPTGTITFNLYGPSGTASCTSTPVFTDTETVSGGTATSASFTPSQAGTYYWTASYNGDTNNNPAATTCGDEQVTIGPHIYWATGSTIMQANLDGTGVTTLVTGQDDPGAVAVDSSHIYWVNSTDANGDLNSGTVMEANLDGTGVTTLVTGQDDPGAVAVDSSHIYWTTETEYPPTGTIMAANLDGTGATTLLTTPNIAGIAVDSSHIYWTNYTDSNFDPNNGTINKANLDGTGATTLLTGQNYPFSLAVDTSHIYWTSPVSGTIMEANLDGTGATTLLTGQNQPLGLAVGP
jgi:hypothetical protein